MSPRLLLDPVTSIGEYLARADWRVNANRGYSLGGLIPNVAGKGIANYRLERICPAETGRAHREADLHIHDQDMLAGCRAGWSLRALPEEGLNGGTLDRGGLGYKAHDDDITGGRVLPPETDAASTCCIAPAILPRRRCTGRGGQCRSHG